MLSPSPCAPTPRFTWRNSFSSLRPEPSNERRAQEILFEGRRPCSRTTALRVPIPTERSATMDEKIWLGFSFIVIFLVCVLAYRRFAILRKTLIRQITQERTRLEQTIQSLER